MRHSAWSGGCWLKVLKKPLSWGVLAKLSLFLEASGREDRLWAAGMATVCPGSLNLHRPGTQSGGTGVPTLMHMPFTFDMRVQYMHTLQQVYAQMFLCMSAPARWML